MKTTMRFLVPIALGFFMAATNGAVLPLPHPGTLAAVDTSSAIDPILKLIESLGVLGVLVWYLWYVTSRDRPRVDARHAASTQDLLSGFRAEAKEQREATALSIGSILEEMKEGQRVVLSVVENCSNVRLLLEQRVGSQDLRIGGQDQRMGWQDQRLGDQAKRIGGTEHRLDVQEHKGEVPIT
jgi:hypothetical protein